MCVALALRRDVLWEWQAVGASLAPRYQREQRLVGSGEAQLCGQQRCELL
jgi:hypothetical protein